MIKASSKKITRYMVKRKTINCEDFELYQYAYETMISTIVNISIILVIGAILNRFTETLLFLVFYCPIRQFSGGFHAENYFKCFLVFITLYLCNMYLVNYIIIMKANGIMIVITLISYVGIILLSPQEHRHNPLTEEERKRYKRVVIYIITFLLALSISGFNLSITQEYAMYGASVLVCIFTMQILGSIKKGVTNL